jgi:hypothetical protein
MSGGGRAGWNRDQRITDRAFAEMLISSCLTLSHWAFVSPSAHRLEVRRSTLPG